MSGSRKVVIKIVILFFECFFLNFKFLSNNLKNISRAIFKHAWWAAYKKVNEDFAAQTLSALWKSTQMDPNQVSHEISNLFTQQQILKLLNQIYTNFLTYLKIVIKSSLLCYFFRQKSVKFRIRNFGIC